MRSYQISLWTQLTLLTLINLLAFARGQQASCFNNGNYTSNSTYQVNLINVLSRLSINIRDNGFYNTSFGQSPNRVYAFALCLGDIQLFTCRSCLRDAAAGILQSCPNYRHAHYWNDLCMLRYSNASIMGIVDEDYSSLRGWLSSRNVSTQPERFMSDLSTLLGNLRSQASNGDSLRKVAAGNISMSASFFPMIFGLVQCTPDLSQQDCFSCLVSVASYLPTCCNAARGARLNARSCFVYYQTAKFYNETRLQELSPHVRSPVPIPTPLPPPPIQPAGNRNNIAGNHNNNTTHTTVVIIIVVSVVAGVIILSLILYLSLTMKRKSKEEIEKGEGVDNISTVQSQHYGFNVIKAATNDFSDDNKLGQGGFRAVYRGKLPNGQEIAVKRLARGSCQGDLEFKNEVMLLAKLQHRNLVRLLGFSFAGQEKLLVYEFVQNASLDHQLFDFTKRALLHWDVRHKIIGGIARGILYLHEDSRLKIIHRDLKASNILLDGDMNPKIADFGMARLFVPDETQGTTSRIVGTYGYMAPEYAMRGQFSIKSDVFSFGVLLLEIISGQKNTCFRHGGTEADLITSAWENWQNETIINLVDPVLMVGSSAPLGVLRCIHIGLLCVQEKATIRPTMAAVMLMLNSRTITLAIPSRPAFYLYEDSDAGTLPQLEFSWTEQNSVQLSSKNDEAEVGDPISENEMSISEFHGR